MDDPVLPNAPLRFLAVGGANVEATSVSGAEQGPDLDFRQFSDLTAKCIADLAPDVVLSPLVCSDFDCFDLAAVLAEAGFRGRYRATTEALPNPALVKCEVSASFPSLDFDIIVMGERDGRTDH